MNKYTLVAYKEIECDYDEYYSAPPLNIVGCHQELQICDRIN